MTGDRFLLWGNFFHRMTGIQPTVFRSLFTCSMLFTALCLGACDDDEAQDMGTGGTLVGPSTADTGATPSASEMNGTTGTGTQNEAELKIVPGEGECPDAKTLLAAPEIARRDLYVGRAGYRVGNSALPGQRWIKSAEEYEQLKKDLTIASEMGNVMLPAVDFSRELVLFGAVLEPGSCGMKIEALRTVTLNGKAHADFISVEERGGVQCNQACGLYEEQIFVIAMDKSVADGATICTRKRIDCKEKK